MRFSSKQSTATVYIKIKDDKIVENTEAFQVAILIPHYLYLKVVRFGSHSKAKVYIKDGMKAYNIYFIVTYNYHLDDKVIVTKPQCKFSYIYASVHTHVCSYVYILYICA